MIWIKFSGSDLLAKGLSRLERVGNGSDYAYVKFNGAQVSWHKLHKKRQQVHIFSTN